MPPSQTLRPMQQDSVNQERSRSIMPLFRSPLSRAVAIVTAVVIVAHLAFIGLPAINFEWAFVDAARYFGLHQPELLVRYFGVEANPLGVPFLAYFIHLILPFLKIDIVPRLLAISGFIFLAFALPTHQRARRHHFIRASPHGDHLPESSDLDLRRAWHRGFLSGGCFALCAVAFLFWDAQDSAPKLILAIVIFGLAIIMKYHAVLLLPIVWLEGLSRPGTNRKSCILIRLCAISCAILLGPAIYIVAVKQSLGFWLAPPLYQGIHHLLLTPTFVITNFISYSGYIALLLTPFSFLPLLETRAFAVRASSRSSGVGLLLFTLGFFRCCSEWRNGLWSA